MTTNSTTAPISPARSLAALSLFVTAVLAMPIGLLMGKGWLLLLGALGVLLPNAILISQGWNAQRDAFNDPVWAPLRRRVWRRVSLATSAVLMIVLLAAGWVGAWRAAVSVIFVLLLPVSVLLHSTRGMVVLANTGLDERQRQRRDAAYRTAYLTVNATLIATVVVMAVVKPPPSTVSTAFMVFVGAAEMLYLPTLICAWNEPEADTE